MPITKIEYGSLASSKQMNDNFNSLEEDIQKLSSDLVVANATITTNNKNLNQQLTQLQSDINTELENINSNLGNLVLVPDYSKGVSVSSGYVVTQPSRM